jgi:single-stranded DNA-binding protein
MAASNLNRVVLTANLTKDPDLRSTPGGTSVCFLRGVGASTRPAALAAIARSSGSRPGEGSGPGRFG